MPSEEFLNFIKQSEERKAYYKALYEGFSKKLPPALAEIVFNYLPELTKQGKNKEQAVLEIGEKYIRNIWEEYNMVYSLNINGGPMAKLNPVKKPTSREEAEKKRLKEIKQFPEQYHKTYTKIFWEQYEDKLAREVFEYSIYEKMKEVFTEFYIDDIMEFNSDCLRSFDRGLYLMCTCSFTEDIYKLL
ncbi:MAG: hypothetical protein HQ522_01185 [Bacteroidetes bacterium]|nr:hypothetical protein [Bacteroidota bacterium]